MKGVYARTSSGTAFAVYNTAADRRVLEAEIRMDHTDWYNPLFKKDAPRPGLSGTP